MFIGTVDTASEFERRATPSVALWPGGGRAIPCGSRGRPSRCLLVRGLPLCAPPPSIIPHGAQQDTYLVLDDFGRIGRAWRETAEEATDRETVIRNLIAGEYSNPIRIVGFNTAEGWSRDVTVDIADEVRRRYAEMDEVTDSVLQFTEANRR